MKFPQEKTIYIYKYDIISDILYNTIKSKISNRIVIVNSYEEMLSVKDDTKLLVSSLTRDDIHITRTYDKRISGDLDLYPFAYQFANDIEPNHDRVVSDKLPKNMNYSLLKKYITINDNTGIITDDNSKPDKYKNWYTFTLPQKEQLTYLYYREKSTRHKEISKERLISI